MRVCRSSFLCLLQNAHLRFPPSQSGGEASMQFSCLCPVLSVFFFKLHSIAMLLRYICLPFLMPVCSLQLFKNYCCRCKHSELRERFPGRHCSGRLLEAVGPAGKRLITIFVRISLSHRIFLYIAWAFFFPHTGLLLLKHRMCHLVCPFSPSSVLYHNHHLHHILLLVSLDVNCLSNTAVLLQRHI